MEVPFMETVIPNTPTYLAIEESYIPFNMGKISPPAFPKKAAGSRHGGDNF